MLKDTEQKLLDIIREAGKIMTTAHDIYDATNQKGGDAANLVTTYDVAVQKYLMEEITALIPNAFFFAEEKENDAKDLEHEYCFIIDPIDGTANFVHQYHKSAISVALLSHGRPQFAAIYDPYLKEMFFAKKGCGAFLNGAPMYVSTRDMSHAIVAFGTSPYYKEALSEKTFRILRALFNRASDIRRPGAASLDLAYLAAGRNDVFFECILSPWDYAAGSLIITEAGGKISDFDGNEIDFSKPTSVFASSEVLYEEALEIVQTED